MSATVKVLDETILTDGSGVSGLYEVYGLKFAGSHETAAASKGAK